jgi:poly-gamma-glutamate synthesis protein (capsule biosynthesis protein)
MKLGSPIRLFLAGDVMLGRGIDQILAHPVDPRIYEDYMTSAEAYVQLAEKQNGPIPRAVDYGYVWGDLLAEDAYRRCDLRIVNLETAITTADKPEPKGINYRMHPANVSALTAASVDACTLANNHSLDWGRPGLVETLETLEAAGIASAGAGRTAEQATELAKLNVAGGGRILLLAFGDDSSGIPPHWAATEDSAGINMLPRTVEHTVERVRHRTAAIRKPGDILLISIHWGDNWGFEIPENQRRLAHALIDAAGADVIFGHSSHHAKGVEVHNGKLVLYGCGDLINDYEGIGGHEQYRGDLAQAYFVDLNPDDGTLAALEIKQYQRRKFRLNASDEGALDWLSRALAHEVLEGAPQFQKSGQHSLRMVQNSDYDFKDCPP